MPNASSFELFLCMFLQNVIQLSYDSSFKSKDENNDYRGVKLSKCSSAAEIVAIKEMQGIMWKITSPMAGIRKQGR